MVKVRFSLRNSTRTPRLVSIFTKERRSSRLRARPVHAVHGEGVSVAGELEQLIELRPFRVPAGGFIGKDPIHLNILQLAEPLRRLKAQKSTLPS